MRVECFTNIDDLAPFAGDWDRLAGGVPFRSWDWLSTWWNHYGQGSDDRGPARRLFTLGVLDRTNRLIGVAPWYVERSRSRGRIVRFLGSGEVCSDYMTLLCQPGRRNRILEELSQWLTSRAFKGNVGGNREWDLIELTGVDAKEEIIARFSEQLMELGSTVHFRPGLSCWKISLPGSWDEFLAMLSKPHRNRLRRAWRNFVDTGRAVLHSVEQEADLDQAWDILVQLHQLRRGSLGEPGCFASRQFADFHRRVMPKLLRNGQLLLQWVELDGKPVAVEYQLSGNRTVYAYQGGMDPKASNIKPGHLAHSLTIRGAIERGYRAYDFMRGDEAYKAHWRAKPVRSLEVRVAPARTSARLRLGLWLAGSKAKRRITAYAKATSDEKTDTRQKTN